MTRIPRAAYVHIPFCLSKCHYCDFDSFPGMGSIFDEYVRALICDIERTPAHADPLATVYLGGGTPTVLPASGLARALGAVEKRFGLEPDAEVTVEANPGTVNEAKFAELRSAGFNRLSLGVQSFDDDFLGRIGRAHSSRDAVEAYHAARRAGFANVGIDLIFALPGQTLSHWETTLDMAIELNPEHVSLYELSVEQGTRFAELCAEGLLDLPDEDIQLAMYELAIAKLAPGGYERYEVSNFARHGFRSRHNQVYWRNEPFHGFGAGATSYVDGIRAHSFSDPQLYIEAVLSGSDAIDFSEELTGPPALAESLMLGLRMLEGVDLQKLSEQTGTDALAEFGPRIEVLEARGLLELTGARLKVTHQGLLLLNDVLQEFM